MTSQSSFRPLHNRRLAEGVVEELVARIRRGDFPPGTRLPSERALVEMFGVSRTVIREALVYMQQAGIVLTRQGSGTFVASGFGLPGTDSARRVRDGSANTSHFEAGTGTGPSTVSAPAHGAAPLTIDDLQDLFELRMAVETEAAALAAVRSTNADRRNMAAALERFDAAATAARLGVEADFDFHHAVVRASHNRYFMHALSGLTEVLTRSVLLSRIRSIAIADRSELVLQEHRNVFERIAAGDAAGARTAMRRHLEAARERLTS